MPKPVLTAAVIDQILFAMEDQDAHRVFNLGTFSVELLRDENLVADDRILPLPPWSSSDGFRMMREFAGTLHHPQVQAELHAVLDSGQGVFRRFKQVLKPRDFLYRQWLRFKRGFMEESIEEWMASYPEYFGDIHAALLSATEPPALLATDFTCREGQSAEVELLEMWDHEACLEAARELFGAEAADVLVQFFRSTRAWQAGDQFWVAVNPEGEWAGVIWTRLWNPEGPASVLNLQLWFVDPIYRGLGLGTTLLQVALAASPPTTPVVLTSPQGGQRVDSVLTRAGFQANGRVWSALRG